MYGKIFMVYLSTLNHNKKYFEICSENINRLSSRINGYVITGQEFAKCSLVQKSIH